MRALINVNVEVTFHVLMIMRMQEVAIGGILYFM